MALHDRVTGRTGNNDLHPGECPAASQRGNVGPAENLASNRSNSSTSFAHLPTRNVSLAYTLEGPTEAPVVVLAHGFASFKEVWRFQIPALTPRYRVLRYDHRGHGESSDGAHSCSIRYLSEDLLALLDAIGIGRVCLVGHSMGGRTLFHFALDHGDRLWGAVVVDGQSEAPQPAFRKELELNYGLLDKGNLEGFYQAAIPQGQVPQRLEREPELRDWYRKHFFANRPQALLPELRAIFEMPRLTDRLGDIQVPVLAFVGDDDKHFHTLARRYGEVIPNSRVVQVAGSHHYPMFDQPEGFNAELLTFLDSWAPAQ